MAVYLNGMSAEETAGMTQANYDLLPRARYQQQIKASRAMCNPFLPIRLVMRRCG